MGSLALAAVTFAALHLLVSGTRLRDVLVARSGENAYRGLFSLASALSLGWLIAAFAKARIALPTPLPELRVLAAALLLVAFYFIVAGLMTPGPTLVGAEKLLEREDNARGVHRITRHPFLWGLSLWAAVHMAFNPEPASLVFFGTFLVVAAAGTFSIDAKRARRFGDAWERYAARTSNVPFAAIAQGRNIMAWGEIGLARPGAAVAAFLLLLGFHARLFGLPPL